MYHLVILQQLPTVKSSSDIKATSGTWMHGLLASIPFFKLLVLWLLKSLVPFNSVLVSLLALRGLVHFMQYAWNIPHASAKC